MNVTSEMYTKLFNEITDIENEMIKLVEKLKNVQIEVEEIYINQEKTDM